MNKEKLITEEDIERAEVRLKPLFGMEPGRWLAIAAGSLLFVLLFAALVLPGLLRPGTLFKVTSRPSEAAVFVDGAYSGTTPCEVFIARGDRDIRVSRPGFSEANLSRTVSGRIFASALAPRRAALYAALPLLDGEALWRTAVEEFSAWSLAGDPSAVWQAPPVLESAARARFADPASPAPVWEERRDFILAAARVVSNPSAARELIRAASLAFGSGNADSPAASEGWEKLFLESPAVAAMLKELAPEDSASLPGIADANTDRSRMPDPAPIGAPSRLVRGVRFLPVSASGGEVTAYLAETETTTGQYAAFLKDNPRWAPGNRDRLTSEGLASPAYLAGFETARPDDPVQGVSWYAARAYAEWLGLSAPAGFGVFLPDESTWALAARAGRGTGGQIWSNGQRTAAVPANDRRRDDAGFADLLGNLWEWCDDSWALRPEIGDEASVRFPGSERAVRGGGWGNAPDSVSAESRGSFPPAWCSPFLGFRPALKAAVRR